MSINPLSNTTASTPPTAANHCYLRNCVKIGCERLNRSNTKFTTRVAEYYSNYFKNCPFYTPVNENGQLETRCSVSGKETALSTVSHDIPLITGFPGRGIGICLEKDNEKVHNAVSAFFKYLHKDMGPYPCYIVESNLTTIGRREDIPDVHIPHSQEKYSLYDIGVDYREEELRIICQVWRDADMLSFPLSALIRANPSISFGKILDQVIPDSFMGIYLKIVLLAKEERDAGIQKFSKKRKVGAELPTPISSTKVTSEPSAPSKIARQETTTSSPTEPESNAWIKSFGPFTINAKSNIFENALWKVKHQGNKLIITRPRFKNEKDKVDSWVANRIAVIQTGKELFSVAAPKFGNLSSLVTRQDHQYIITVHGASNASEVINAVFV